MTLLEAIEAGHHSRSKRAFYRKIILIAVVVVIAFSAIGFFGVGTKTKPHELEDFDAFYVVGQLAQRGEIDKAYHFRSMAEVQRSQYFPWTYPPPFDLVVALLACFSCGLAYSLFISGSLAAYFLTLRRIASESYVPVLLIIFPALIINIRSGQNGLLTGALIGIACLYLRKGSALAGVPLGLMVIKPHLAIAFAIYAFANRRWNVVAVALATAAVSAIAATLTLGTGVWTAFFHGVQEASIFLARGFYPLSRMVSFYSVVRSFGLPASLAMIGQVFVALVALALVIIASYRFSVRQALGLTAIASLLVSPYAYDYDLTIMGVGLALLFPDFVRFGSKSERTSLYALSFFACSFGLATTFVMGSGGDTSVSLAGLALLAVFGLSWRLVQRGQKLAATAQTAPMTTIEGDALPAS
jgi:Glycosyltransferase family 87